MQHKFDGENSLDLHGTWFKDNGRKFCSWRFDAADRILKAGRGIVVHSKQLEAPTDLERLREELPRLALELACEDIEQNPVLH